MLQRTGAASVGQRQAAHHKRWWSH
jgi:hypothetical protein